MAGVFRSLEPSDISITPFQAYKEWKSGSDYVIYTASYGNRSSYNAGPFIDTFDLGNPAISLQNSEPTTYGGKYQRIVHDSINHLFYKDYYRNPYGVFSDPFIGFQKRDLRQYAQIINFPQHNVGEGILKESVDITIGGTSFYDDGYGNLLNRSFDIITSSLVNNDDVLAHFRFYDLYPYKDQPSITYSTIDYSTDFKYKVSYSNIVVTESNYHGFDRSPAPYFTSSLSSSIEISYDVNPKFLEYLNFQDTDFAISMMLSIPIDYSQSAPPTTSLVTKNGRYQYYAANANGVNELYTNTDRTVYPYQILLINDPTNGPYIQADRSNGQQTISVTSSYLAYNNFGTYFNVIYQKTGSNIELYIDNVLQQTGSDFATTNQLKPINRSNVYIGSLGGDDLFHTGGITQLMFVEKATTSDQRSAIFTTRGTNTTAFGNVFYEHGMVVITSPLLAAQDVTYARVRGTQTIYEYQVTCTSPAGEHNLTFNPSILEYDPVTKQKKVKNMFTASYFNPYVTSIGLYNDNGELLVVGKLPNPVQKLDNIDMTYVLKFDR